MARPIQPTPTITGKDAERLLRSLENCCTPEQAQERLEKAKEYLAEVMRDKGFNKIPPRK